MNNIAIYPGSFDPVTSGHVDIICRASRIFDKVIVAVSDNFNKSPLFSTQERLRMLKQAAGRSGNVKIEAFDGLVTAFAKEKKSRIIIRGLRMISDFDYEFQMALTNRRLAPDIETLFLMASENNSFISSTLLKEAAALGADVSSFVPRFVEKPLKKRLSERIFLKAGRAREAR
jgi:pantetheine-phosphate adenylyltransferase